MNTIVVAAAVVERDGTFLVTRRLPGTHLAGAWEFPGGKCLPGEPLETCLTRELMEELAVGATVGREILTTAHDYPERHVRLHFFECSLVGDPVAQLGQELQWVARERLRDLEFPPADEELIVKLTEKQL